MHISERFTLFYERLLILPPFTSHVHAMEEIARVLIAVEDEHSGVPRDPSDMPLVTDGRMYPPHPAFAKDTGIPGVTLYTQKGHHPYVSADGAVLILNRRTQLVEFEKPDHRGGRIER